MSSNDKLQRENHKRLFSGKIALFRSKTKPTHVYVRQIEGGRERENTNETTYVRPIQIAIWQIECQGARRKVGRFPRFPAFQTTVGGRLSFSLTYRHRLPRASDISQLQNVDHPGYGNARVGSLGLQNNERGFGCISRSKGDIWGRRNGIFNRSWRKCSARNVKWTSWN